MGTKITILTIMLVFSVVFCPNFISQSYATNTQVVSEIERNASSTIMQSFGRQPLFFIQNNGQIDETVKYYERGSGHATYFAQDGIYLNVFKQRRIQDNTIDILSDNVKLSFSHANKNLQIVAEGQLLTKFNYFNGCDPQKWHKKIPTYNAIRYKEIYENIDLKVYGNNRQLEYDVVIKPGGNPEVVKFRYEGANSLAVNAQGELEIKLDHGTLIQRAPYLYQEVNGKQVEVLGSFKLLGDNSYTFEIDSYDTEKQLVIDPVIEYSGYIGGDWQDLGNSVTIDIAGNAYITGHTYSYYFPTPSYPRDVVTYKYDAFVYKVAPDGTMVYATVFGGTATDWISGAVREAGNDIAVDSSGNAHVIGSTMSIDFPTTTGAFQSNLAGHQIQVKADAFYTILDSTGNMSYSSYLGGANIDLGYTIAVDNSDNAYIAGFTAPHHYLIPPDFPVVNALQPTYGGGMDFAASHYPSDGFVAKFHFDAADPSNASIVFATYFGGDDSDSISGLALDNSGNIYVTGSTRSDNLPGASTSTIQSTRGAGADAFVSKINAAGTAIVYSTYLGGNRNDYGTAIDVDSMGSAYLTGYILQPGTDYSSFPLLNSIQAETAGEHAVFVTKINADGSSMDYSTFLGGESSDRGLDIVVDSNGSAYIAGTTTSLNFPIFNPINGHGELLGLSDGFVVRLTPSGSGFLYSTFFGGDGGADIYAEPGADNILGIAVDDNGNAYVTGATNTHCLPAPESGSGPTCSGGFGGHTDGFVAKIFDSSPIPPEVISVSPVNGEVDVPVDTVVTVTFNRDMTTTTFNGNFTLSTGGVPVPGTVGNIGFRTATFTPSASMTTGRIYTATITTGVQDSGGAPLLANYTWDFTAAPDTTPPTILFTNPASDFNLPPVQDVAVDTVVTVTFSEDVDPATITTSSFYLQWWDNNAASYISIAGIVSYDSATHTATFTPDNYLPYSVYIELSVENTVTDLAGNFLYIDSGFGFPLPTYNHSFHTVCDPLGPTVLATSPAFGAVDVPVDTTISFTFDKDIDPATIDQNSFELWPYPSWASKIPGNISYDVLTRTLSFSPDTSLQPGDSYYGIVSNNFVDTDGRWLCHTVGVLFTTANFIDTDNDGIPDEIEDTNMDGIVDPGETDPYNPDTDGDGLSDGVEDANHNGVVDGSETDPRSADTDNDGMPDGWETDNLLDPLVDDALGDDDHDGASNLDEYLNNTDPNDPSSFPVKSNSGIILLLLGD